MDKMDGDRTRRLGGSLKEDGERSYRTFLVFSLADIFSYMCTRDVVGRRNRAFTMLRKGFKHVVTATDKYELVIKHVVPYLLVVTNCYEYSWPKKATREAS
jgi:hypothetical protein